MRNLPRLYYGNYLDVRHQYYHDWNEKLYDHQRERIGQMSRRVGPLFPANVVQEQRGVWEENVFGPSEERRRKHSQNGDEPDQCDDEAYLRELQWIGKKNIFMHEWDLDGPRFIHRGLG